MKRRDFLKRLVAAPVVLPAAAAVVAAEPVFRTGLIKSFVPETATGLSIMQDSQAAWAYTKYMKPFEFTSEALVFNERGVDYPIFLESTPRAESWDDLYGEDDDGTD
jgi:hypothetical protein